MMDDCQRLCIVYQRLICSAPVTAYLHSCPHILFTSCSRSQARFGFSIFCLFCMIKYFLLVLSVLMGVQLCYRLLLWTLTYLWSKLFIYCMSRHVLLFSFPPIPSVWLVKPYNDLSLRLKEKIKLPLSYFFLWRFILSTFWRYKKHPISIWSKG